MWIVAIGWSYVVILMAATETSFTAGVMTFLVYCMIPLSILFYLTGTKRRRARRAARTAGVAKAAPGAAEAGAMPPPPALAVAKNRQDDGVIGASSAPAGTCDGGDGGCGE